MNVDRRVALSNFYREEFLRHIEYLQASGILDDGDSGAVTRARRALMTRLDDACSQASFPAVAESLLQGFDTLTRLSRRDPSPRPRH